MFLAEVQLVTPQKFFSRLIYATMPIISRYLLLSNEWYAMIHFTKIIIEGIERSL